MDATVSRHTWDRSWGYNARQETVWRQPGGWRWAQRDKLVQDTGGRQNNRERRRKADGSCLLGVGRLAQPEAITSNGRDGVEQTRRAARGHKHTCEGSEGPTSSSSGFQSQAAPSRAISDRLKTVSVPTSRESFCFFLILRTYWQKKCKGSV